MHVERGSECAWGEKGTHSDSGRLVPYRGYDQKVNMLNTI